MTERTPVQTVALLVGIVFLLVGILGFIPGITTEAPGDFAGRDSEAELLGIFQVSWLHSIVHLLFGIAGLLLARTFSGARTYLIGGGIIYAGLFLYGIIVGTDSEANFVPMNGADNVLHLALGLGMIAAGYILGRQPALQRTAV